MATWVYLCLRGYNMTQCGGRHFQVLCELFSPPQIPKTVQLSTGKIQLNVTHWTQCLRCDFCRERYKFHSLLGSVGKLSAETNFDFPSPPFNHISGICKNLADTWLAATRVLSRRKGRERTLGTKLDDEHRRSIFLGDWRGHVSVQGNYFQFLAPKTPFLAFLPEVTSQPENHSRKNSVAKRPFIFC